MNQELPRRMFVRQCFCIKRIVTVEALTVDSNGPFMRADTSLVQITVSQNIDVFGRLETEKYRVRVQFRLSV